MREQNRTRMGGQFPWFSAGASCFRHLMQTGRPFSKTNEGSRFSELSYGDRRALLSPADCPSIKG